MISNKQVYIIAEAGVNHNGSVEMAKELVYQAKIAGADAVKFQTFKTNKVISRFAEKAEYQKKTTDHQESQLEMVKKLELNAEDHRILKKYCDSCGIEFLSTPFDFESVELLVNDIGVPLLKVPSGEITNAPLLLKVAKTKLPLIVSTGMSRLGEVEQALSVIALGYSSKGNCLPSIEAFEDAYNSEEMQNLLKERVTLLHCTTEYPSPFEDVNLKAMDTLVSAFGLSVGLSDHTVGVAVPIAAVARGAKVIEKHFTLDRNLPGPDHKASLEPSELRLLVESIRQVERALGSGQKKPATSEQKNKEIARKSIVAALPIKKGDIFTEKNLDFKRPGTGVSPMNFWELLGKKASKDFLEDEVITTHVD